MNFWIYTDSNALTVCACNILLFARTVTSYSVQRQYLTLTQQQINLMRLLFVIKLSESISCDGCQMTCALISGFIKQYLYYYCVLFMIFCSKITDKFEY